MASVSNDGDGRRLLFLFRGRRKAIRLGKVTAKEADAVKLRVERLLVSLHADLPLDGETAQWLARIGDDLAEKLAAAGLIPARVSKAAGLTVGQFLDAYIADRAAVKPNTLKNFRQARKNLLGFVGAATPLSAVTPGTADDWLLWLRKEGFARASIGRCVKYARQFFHAAVRAGHLQANPFAGVKGPAQVNDARDYFVTAEMGRRVLEVCPDDGWRLIFALCRWGGLRCPSELRGLLPGEVDRDRGRFLVHSPKTEHHPGGESRWVPIFPELAGLIDLLPVPESRTCAPYLRRRVLDFIAAAGLKPWPKLFANLRSTRETELAAIHPPHVVCAWLGNSPRVAFDHYLQVTDGDFVRAVGSIGIPIDPSPAQNPAQQGAEWGGMGRKENRPQPPETQEIAAGVPDCTDVQYARQEYDLPAQVVSGTELRTLPFPAGAESGALARLVALWPFLSVSVRAAVLRLAEGRAAA